MQFQSHLWWREDSFIVSGIFLGFWPFSEVTLSKFWSKMPKSLCDLRVLLFWMAWSEVIFILLFVLFGSRMLSCSDFNCSFFQGFIPFLNCILVFLSVVDSASFPSFFRLCDIFIPDDVALLGSLKPRILFFISPSSNFALNIQQI